MAGAGTPQRNFSTLWIAHGVNALGLQIRLLAFPLLAVQVLGAAPSRSAC